jgi:hypothetical protein
VPGELDVVASATGRATVKLTPRDLHGKELLRLLQPANLIPILTNVLAMNWRTARRCTNTACVCVRVHE